MAMGVYTYVRESGRDREREQRKDGGLKEKRCVYICPRFSYCIHFCFAYSLSQSSLSFSVCFAGGGSGGDDDDDGGG